MPVLDECSETSPSWLQQGTLDMVKTDGLKMGCSETWLRRVYELQSPNWHCVHSRAWWSRESVVERHAGDVEEKLAVHDQKKEC